MKQIKGAASVLGFGSAHKLSKHKEKRSIFEIEARLPSSGQVSNERENPLWDSNLKDKESETKSILMQASLPNESVKESSSNDKPRRKPFKTLFQQQQREGDGGGGGDNGLNYFFIDKVLGDKIKKELSKIQTELCTTNPSLKFSDDQIEAISTKLPVDKGDLKKFFPKSWCDRYGDVVLDVVKKEFKDHVGDMENMRNVAREKHHNNSKRWTTFEDDNENCHPNLFSRQDHHSFPNNKKFTATNDHNAYTNPFSNDSSEINGNKLMTESFQNPFWIPRQQH
ncbi:hypothetical protein OIU84_000853 [Salix udensis]|uniref:Uncharacterized protein n=1 Tax=Salix udensis TaxID=889485 RepID=A0AAD6L6S5_9ROSI|nr:hypothetical protein OIU84_000853 [Salix udensis]